MSVRIEIEDVNTSPDGFTYVTFSAHGVDGLLARHQQGFPAELERVAEPRTREVPQRDLNGDVVQGDSGPVIILEAYDEMVETGRWVGPSAATVHEAIANYVRDVLPLRQVQPGVSEGDSFEVG